MDTEKNCNRFETLLTSNLLDGDDSHFSSNGESQFLLPVGARSDLIPTILFLSLPNLYKLIKPIFDESPIRFGDPGTSKIIQFSKLR
jgi:hypothetical protein